MALSNATSRSLRGKEKSETDCCRICMVPERNMNGIFEAESDHIVQEILYCTGVTLKKEAGLPTKICPQCLKNLSVAYNFKKSCLLAEKTFHSVISKTSIKIELSDSSDDDYTFLRNIMEEEEEFEKKVKEEPKLEPVDDIDRHGQCNAKTDKSILPTVNPKRVGRPKTGSKRPMKKFKFKRLHCEHCDMKFDNKQQSDEHKKTEHKESNCWVCEICGKMFVHRASHYTHVRSHFPPKFACDRCDYKSCQKSDLVKHLRIHNGVKLYQCEFCTASYYTSSNLTGHIRRNHIKERPYECSTCHKHFFDKTKLNRHMDSHNEIKRFECEVCHACFSRRCYWKKHLLTKHDIITPRQRPGRQKVNAIVGQDLVEQVSLVVSSMSTDFIDKTKTDSYISQSIANEV